MRALVLALMLASCAAGRAPEELPAPQLPERAGVDPIVAARSEGVEFRAVGDGVVVDILNDRIRLSRSPGTEVIDFPKPEPIFPRSNGEVYETENEGRSLAIAIERSHPCQSDNRALYPIRVELVFDGQPMAACGRDF